MKKIFALLLAAAILLTMTACGGAAEPAKPVETAAPTAALTEAPTEPVKTEPAVLSWPSNDTYTMVLRGLGYKEVDFSNHVIGNGETYFDKDGNISASPIPSATVYNIQFLGDTVRVEFSWYEFEDRYEEDGWQLYCTKADSVDNISGLNPEDYDVYDAFDHNEMTGEASDFVEIWKYIYMKEPDKMAFVTAYFAQSPAPVQKRRGCRGLSAGFGS